MKATIEEVDNGFILSVDYGEDDMAPRRYVIEAKSGNEDEGTDELSQEQVAFYELLWELLDIFEMGGSKHDPARIKIRVEPRLAKAFDGDEPCPKCGMIIDDRQYHPCEH